MIEGYRIPRSCRVISNDELAQPDRVHSVRSAITGSILVARRAGSHEAHSVTSSNTTETVR
jgi:hypothetical protein